MMNKADHVFFVDETHTALLHQTLVEGATEIKFNPLMGTGALSKIMKLVHWPLMGGLLHLVQQGGD